MFRHDVQVICNLFNIGSVEFTKDQIVTCKLCKKIFRVKGCSNGKNGC